jgi:hypothetical protein
VATAWSSRTSFRTSRRPSSTSPPRLQFDRW